MDRLSSGLRRAALERIAVLSGKETNIHSEIQSLNRLSRECGPRRIFHPNGGINGFPKPPAETTQIPMTLRELDVILSLCKIALVVQNLDSAEKLLNQLSPYLIESYNQKISSSPLFRDIEPSPWECLTSNLASALLTLGINFPSLRVYVLDTVNTYLHNTLSASEEEFGEDVQDLFPLVVSFLGFLEASALHANFWSSQERVSLVSKIRRIISEHFLVNVETACSAIRHSHEGSMRQWKRYQNHYDNIGRPLGAMLLQRGAMHLLVTSTSMLVVDSVGLKDDDVLDMLMSEDQIPGINIKRDLSTVESFAEIAAEEIAVIEDGADYALMGTEWQKRLVFSVKAHVLTSYCNCVVLSDAVADPNALYKWLVATITDPVQMSDPSLASVTLKALAILSKDDPESAASFISTLHKFIVENAPSREAVKVAAKCLSYILQFMPQDATITTLNTLGHILSSTNPDRALKGERLQPFDQQTLGGSSLSLVSNAEEDRLNVYSNVIEALVGVASNCKDEKMVSLAQSILIQRINKVNTAVNAKILIGLAPLALISTPTDFKSLLLVYNKNSLDAISQDDINLTNAVFEARTILSKNLTRESQLYDPYLTDILETLGSIGDPRESDEKKQLDSLLAVREITQLFSPLAILLSKNGSESNFALRHGFTPLLRDFWFNCAVHGIYYGSEIANKFSSELTTIAKYTPPLIAGIQEDDSVESDLEQHPVLRRGLNSQNAFEQKRRLISLLPTNDVDIRSLSYPRVIFLEAIILLECLRAEVGGCSKVLAYFVEPGFKTGEAAGCMVSVGNKVANIYLSKVRSGAQHEFSASRIAEELAEIFVGCCHRLEKVQQIALATADRVITTLPSALCQEASLFALLELLTLMWVSCLEEETDEYATRSIFTSARGRVTIELPDSYNFRRKTLRGLRMKAKAWVLMVLNVAPLDVKGLLQNYLSEFEDEGGSGHVSLGKSFALEMGGAVPSSDQRLGTYPFPMTYIDEWGDRKTTYSEIASIEQLGDYDANIASDFVDQYTIRQAYRADPASDYSNDWPSSKKLNDPTNTISPHPHPDSVYAVLRQIESTSYDSDFVNMGEMRNILRKAAALVCRSEEYQGALIHRLVEIPFSIFTKQSVKLGISLWTGVINENPRLQSRILVEIARNWEATVERKMGLFTDSFKAYDAFDMKMEYSPSDREQHIVEQQAALELLSPHLRLLQLLSSHYHATRHGNPHVQKIFLRLVRISLVGLKKATGHPLAREARFQLVLFSLQVLKGSASSLSEKQQWRLKDMILSAALSWFAFPPRWSFGANKLQVKAEAHLLQDVANLLQTISGIVGKNNNLRLKQDLLVLLVENEQTRLATWLYPLDHSRKHHLLPSYSPKPHTDNSISLVLNAAWNENSAIAVQLVHRFQSQRLEQDVRRLILTYPEKVVDQPDAVQIMLGDKLSSHLTFQLKYLLYWTPINPITAATYFLPSYANNSFILQYAMRSLESYSIDITFFYVPQIVQTLRYDTLGYVERFILETAKFSQLFAHQIIWNMKANAFKDEDSQIPDPVKPTLDHVMNRLINSFSGQDKSFYEREFNFFGEVTAISGKLRPFIKKTKAEKNQKIAEELAKIKVDVGVYLPSNPDGVVIDIDRKSGKSLQSHAKAPFLATFRIKRKPITSVDQHETHGHRRGESVSTITKEMWQSAIFKVGDDCRQDMLALQLISTFRSIFNTVGLDVYVFPYRVTATAPGCGVIDVLPKSISRDMLGRDYEMGLYDYFINKYGDEESIRFQEARNNFVKSMAAYSVISYLLKFKDRHNGNIMIDDAGHILHIDFGFCFDIAPGGITFERAPFKLTTEMISVMGGSTESQSYLWFEELCVKSFLACRSYVDKLTHCVVLMLDSGLPCFKPETIQNFRDRFVLDKSEREAADHMRYLVKKSYGSYSTGQYDRFQHLTNGIPY